VAVIPSSPVQTILRETLKIFWIMLVGIPVLPDTIASLLEVTFGSVPVLTVLVATVRLTQPPSSKVNPVSVTFIPTAASNLVGYKLKAIAILAIWLLQPQFLDLVHSEREYDLDL
jgi:hypothetical protein